MHKFTRLGKLDVHAVIRHSFFEIFIPIFMFIPFMIINNSLLFTKVILIFITIANLDILNKGFSFYPMINYSVNINAFLTYSSSKYILSNIFYITIILLLLSVFNHVHFFIVFINLVNVSIVLLLVYFLLFFYLLKSTEPNILAIGILFPFGIITYLLSSLLVSALGIWSLFIVFITAVIYFKIFVPLLIQIFLDRFELIMEKIL
jgi:hypothetical protein